MEIWSILPVKAGDELWIDYGDNFVSPSWYEDLMTQRKLTPLSGLAGVIDKMYQKPGVMDMKVTSKKSAGFYARSAQKFLRGEGKDGEPGEPVQVLNISGLGDAVNTAIAVATALESDGSGLVAKIHTSYPNFVSFGQEGPIFRGTCRVEVTVNKK